MKSLNKNQTVEEFNETLKEGIADGFILEEDGLDFLKELYANLVYYFTFFVSAEKVYGKKEK